MDVTIRPAGVDDAMTLASLIHAAFEEYGGWLVPPSAALLETPETIAKQLAQGHGAALAELHNTPIGCVVFEPRGADLYFGRLSVQPARRGTGVAAALVRFVEAEAARRGCDGVLLSVRIALPDNQRFFAHLGYVEVGRGTHPGFDAHTWIDMRKAI